MHTFIHRTKPTRRSRHAASASALTRSPHFDSRQQPGAMQLVIYVPGVEAVGVEITVCGPDLTVTARKTRFVRSNWSALQLEKAQHDYELRLRLGHGYDYDALRAEIRDGVLTLTLPEKHSSSLPAAEHLSHVA
jgi:HSP20 family protein